MSTTVEPPPGLTPPEDEPPALQGGGGFGDWLFRTLAVVAGVLIMVALAAVFIFLGLEGIPGLTVGPDFYSGNPSFLSLVLRLLWGTTYVAVMSLLIAVPFALGVALFISHYAPRWLATPVSYVIDLLAAVPSVVFGLWGAIALGSFIQPLHEWLHDVLGWLPFFSPTPSSNGQTMLTASIVLAVMILPIITSLCREIFAQTPTLHQEAALALGATRWEMVRYAVFPYARSGMVSAIMLGLGRGLGETMAVSMVMGSAPVFTLAMIGTQNPRTIAAHIALNYKETTPNMVSVLIACGLVLFAFTFAVNALARWIVGRSQRKLDA